MVTESSEQSSQKALSPEQIAAFYHDQFVEDQIRDFTRLVGSGVATVTDIGGGYGYFAIRLQQVTNGRVRVIDTDPESVQSCKARGLEAICGDALNPGVKDSQDAVTFNLILHHLVGTSERVTRRLQMGAIEQWRTQARVVFVNEYIYESFIGDISGWLIFRITKSRLLSAIGSWASRYVTALRANTFGVGVRFRSHQAWVRLFEEAGFDVKASTLGNSERIAPLWRALLIRRISRNSFLLEPRSVGRH